MGAVDELIRSAHRSGITYTEDDLNNLVGGVGAVDVTFDTEGDTAADTIRATFQFKDKNGNPFIGRIQASVYLSGNAKGTVLPTVPTGAVAVATAGPPDGSLELVVHTAKLVFDVVSDGLGKFEIDVTDSGTPTFWWAVQLPDSRLFVSPGFTFA